MLELTQSGTAQASVDLDANRLVLLDRIENGDSEDTTEEEQIPF